MTCTILGVFANLQKTSAMNITTRSVNSSGLIYLFERNILIKQGNFHVNISTNLNPRNDIKKIETYKTDFEKVCKKSMLKFSNLICDTQLHELKSTASHVIQNIKLIENKSPIIRVPRSTQKGAFFRLLDWLFGGTEPDDIHDAKSMGIIEHSISAFKDMENQIYTKNKHLQRELLDVSFNIEKTSATAFKQNNIDYINIQTMNIYNLMNENIQRMNEKYLQAEKLIMNKTEFYTIINRINLQIAEGTIPDITTDQIISLTSSKAQFIENQNINIILNFPITMKEIFEEHFVTPLPDPISKRIATSPPQNIIINHILQQFITPTDITIINETFAITSEPITIFNKIQTNTDCTISSFLLLKGTCKTKTLPTTYDVWLATPLHNTFSFYSNLKKNLICPNSRSLINENAGIITIQNDCKIETPTTTITASKDLNSIQKHAFKFDLEDIPEITELQIKPKPVNIHFDDTPFDETSLNKVLTEAAEATTIHDTPILPIIITILATLFSTLLITFTLCFIFRKKLLKTPRKPIRERVHLIKLESPMESPNTETFQAIIEDPIETS